MRIAVKNILIWAGSILLCFCSCKPSKYDVFQENGVVVENSINKFVLRDTSYTCRLNILPKNMINDYDKGEGVYFTNKQHTEFLFLSLENGGMNGQYDYFYLSNSIPKVYKSKAIVLSDSTFVTTKHLHLGSSLREFKKLIGNINFKVECKGDEKHFLYRDSIEQYSCLYKFYKSRLVHIEFGYVW